MLDKEFILESFNRLIKSTRLWDEFIDGVYKVFDAELTETKYIESLEIHQELVWDLIKMYRGYEEIDIQEWDIFIETIWDLAAGKPFEYQDENGEKIILTDNASVLNLFLSPDFIIRETLIIDPDFYNSN